MNILSIDTANVCCSVAITSQGNILSSQICHEPNKQAELLLCITEQVLEKSNLTYQGIDAFAVTKGPGSFTGIRIGIAAAQGLSLIAKKNIYGISTLEVIAFMLSKNNPENKNIYATLHAGRGNVYCQIFNSNLDKLTEPNIVSIAELHITDALLVSNIDIKGAIKIIPDAVNTGLLTYKKFQAGEEMPVDPLYIR